MCPVYCALLSILPVKSRNHPQVGFVSVKPSFLQNNNAPKDLTAAPTATALASAPIGGLAGRPPYTPQPSAHQRGLKSEGRGLH